jgi:aminoglycoside phosphotransferase (APT) family kinase protein
VNSTLDDLAVEIAARYGIAPHRIRERPGGVANRIYLLGDDLVLRLPRSRVFAADLRKEAAVLPVVCAAGVRTTSLVSFAEEPVTHLVSTRLPGTDLVDAELTGVTGRRLGRELAKLHRITAELPDVPVDAGPPDTAVLVAVLAADGWIDAGAARWMDDWFARLTPLLPRTPERVLVHGDIAPQNLLVRPDGELGGIVDWGDAMWADPAAEFAKLRLSLVPSVLAGYRAGGAPDSDWEARVLWHCLVWALGRIADRAPRPGERHWTAPPASRLLDLLRLFSSGAAEPWRRLGSTDAAGNRRRPAAS